MLIVIPRAFSSGALSMLSYARYCAFPSICETFVIAAVSVVFPWSMCPIVPTFRCGLLRSYFCFAMIFSLIMNTKTFLLLTAQRALNGIRTHDLALTKGTLYHLSYEGLPFPEPPASTDPFWS